MSKPKTNKTKKPSAPKAKAAPKKAKPASNGKHPDTEMSVPMKAALEAVATMPVGKVSKLEAIVELLKRPEGATIDDIIGVTGWQKHTVRAALSHALAKKRGYQIVSEKPANGYSVVSNKPEFGKRVYKIAAPAQSDH
ncbi:MAG: DUF3489 domain-containing protein [Alphaproteobacteria bacterium]|nr:DUF3489 domain-containing protein [Alphaproteobacteria bacterium]